MFGVKLERLPIIARLETILDLEGRESRGKRNGPVFPAKKPGHSDVLSWVTDSAGRLAPQPPTSTERWRV